jgi:hypothetical protein
MLSTSLQINAKIARIFIHLPIKRLLSAYVLWAVFLFAPVESFAAMQSANYRIYEALPDSGQVAGPIISAVTVAAITSSGATISWQTDGQADSYVVYSTDPGFADSFEYGLASQVGPSHSVNLVYLAASTKYYYQVKSTNPAGGTTVKNDGNSFTTAASAAPTVSSSGSGGGGGILYVDNSDKAAPIISNFDVTGLAAAGAKAVWKTNEPANSFVRVTLPDGKIRIFGQWDEVLLHQVEIMDCTPQTRYNFDAISTDRAGNMAVSPKHFFKTLEAPARPQAVETAKPSTGTDKPQPAPSAAVYAPQKPLPNQGAGTVRPQSGSTTGPTDGKPTSTPTATNSASKVPTVKTEAMESKELAISNFDFVVVRAGDVIFRWLTNFPADTRISLVPKVDGQLQFERAIEYSAKAYSLHHQAEFKNLETGVVYEIRLFGRDNKGVLAARTVSDFSSGSTVQKQDKAASSQEKSQAGWVSRLASRLQHGAESAISRIITSVKSFFAKIIK